MDQLEWILRKIMWCIWPLPISFQEKKGGHFFLLLPKDERSASLEGVQLSGLKNKPLA